MKEEPVSSNEGDNDEETDKIIGDTSQTTRAQRYVLKTMKSLLPPDVQQRLEEEKTSDKPGTRSLYFL